MELRRGPLELRGELETEARGTGLVSPRLLSPDPLHGVTVIVTGDEEPAAVFTIVGYEKKKKINDPDLRKKKKKLGTLVGSRAF